METAQPFSTPRVVRTSRHRGQDRQRARCFPAITTRHTPHAARRTPHLLLLRPRKDPGRHFPSATEPRPAAYMGRRTVAGEAAQNVSDMLTVSGKCGPEVLTKGGRTDQFRDVGLISPKGQDVICITRGRARGRVRPDPLIRGYLKRQCRLQDRCVQIGAMMRILWLTT